MSEDIRDALFSHRIFHATTKTTAFGISSIRNVETIWSYSESEVQAELEGLEKEGLLELTDSGHWRSTHKGKVCREKRWQELGMRHDALTEYNGEIEDLIVALVASGHWPGEKTDYKGFRRDTLPIYLWRFKEEEISNAVRRLVDKGYVRVVKMMGAELYLTADGNRAFIEEIGPKLGVYESHSILLPLVVIEGLAQLSLDEKLRNNLHSRWEEAIRCAENGCFLSALILSGSVLEGILLALLQRNIRQDLESSKVPRRGTRKITRIEDCTLNNML